jgi:hypothetical protein
MEKYEVQTLANEVVKSVLYQISKYEIHITRKPSDNSYVIRVEERR